jgi:hypothetical protein
MKSAKYHQRLCVPHPSPVGRPLVGSSLLIEISVVPFVPMSDFHCTLEPNRQRLAVPGKMRTEGHRDIDPRIVANTTQSSMEEGQHGDIQLHDHQTREGWNVEDKTQHRGS